MQDDFHPRFSTVSKEYVYTIDTSGEVNVFSRNYSWQYKSDLDIKLMNEAASYIVGEQDFCSFMTTGPVMETTVRNVMSLNISQKDSIVKINIRADGFLYNMVRIITGTLVLVGEGKIEPVYVKEIISAKNRSLAGPTAPPQGLALYRIYY